MLPCCAFEFDGTKYQRRSSKNSQYHDFLDYIKKIIKVCGYSCVIDRLKIPSTKRICFIGYKRKIPIDSLIIQQFIDKESKTCNNSVSDDKKSTWNENFIPRSNIEPIQNCTKIDKNIEQEIIRIVFDQVIVKKRYTNENDDFSIKNWNIGGIISLADVAKKIPKEKLCQLKSECGGIQTLLRNNHQIFMVHQGTVQLRIPIKYSVRLHQAQLQNKEFTFKEKLCWFKENHPDGCPFADIDCSFKH